LKQAGEWMVKSLGTQGFRIDAAKHMPAEFVKDYLNHGDLKSQYAVIEHWDNAETLYDYVKRGLDSRAAAFDFPLWSNLREMSQGGGFYDLRRLMRTGFLGMAPELSVTFVENHDTDRDHATTKNKHLGYAYILTSEGYPCVFWRDYFDYGMKSLLQNLIWIHEALAHGGTEYRWADQDLLVYERMGQPGVLVGINDSSWETRSEWVQTHFAPNTELQDYTGKQGNLWTDNQGRVKITVPPNNFVAFSRAGVQFQFPTSNYLTTQEFVGAEDLDIKPALNNQYSPVGYIYVQGGTVMDWELTYERSGWSSSSKVVAQILDQNNQLISKNIYGPSIGLARGSTMATTTGWYRLEISAENTPAPVRFWWKQTYQAPQH
jgi:alpha-amylase